MLWGLKIDYDIKVLLFKVLHEYEYCLYHSPHPLKVERRLKAVWKPKLIWEVWAQVPMTLWGLFGYVLVSFWPPGVNMVLFPGPSHDLSHLPCKIVFRIQEKFPRDIYIVTWSRANSWSISRTMSYVWQSCTERFLKLNTGTCKWRQRRVYPLSVAVYSNYPQI